MVKLERHAVEMASPLRSLLSGTEPGQICGYEAMVAFETPSVFDSCLSLWQFISAAIMDQLKDELHQVSLYFPYIIIF